MRSGPFTGFCGRSKSCICLPSSVLRASSAANCCSRFSRSAFSGPFSLARRALRRLMFLLTCSASSFSARTDVPEISANHSATFGMAAANALPILMMAGNAFDNPSVSCTLSTVERIVSLSCAVSALPITSFPTMAPHSRAWSIDRRSPALPSSSNSAMRGPARTPNSAAAAAARSAGVSICASLSAKSRITASVLRTSPPALRTDTPICSSTLAAAPVPCAASPIRLAAFSRDVLNVDSSTPDNCAANCQLCSASVDTPVAADSLPIESANPIAAVVAAPNAAGPATATSEPLSLLTDLRAESNALLVLALKRSIDRCASFSPSLKRALLRPRPMVTDPTVAIRTSGVYCGRVRPCGPVAQLLRAACSAG